MGEWENGRIVERSNGQDGHLNSQRHWSVAADESGPVGNARSGSSMDIYVVFMVEGTLSPAVNALGNELAYGMYSVCMAFCTSTLQGGIHTYITYIPSMAFQTYVHSTAMEP